MMVALAAAAAIGAAFVNAAAIVATAVGQRTPCMVENVAPVPGIAAAAADAMALDSATIDTVPPAFVSAAIAGMALAMPAFAAENHAATETGGFVAIVQENPMHAGSNLSGAQEPADMVVNLLGAAAPLVD